MEINFKPSYYNKTNPKISDKTTYIVDTLERYLLYEFSLSETYMLDAKFSEQKDPRVQIELLNKILRDLSRSSQYIQELKEKIEHSISQDIKIEDEREI